LFFSRRKPLENILFFKSKVYNVHGVPLKKAEGEKKSKLDKNNNKSQKFANSFVNQVNKKQQQ
jgi:hypothetical protein